jgi:uncharacterized repeat protein (TIGR01451 family)
MTTTASGWTRRRWRIVPLAGGCLAFAAASALAGPPPCPKTPPATDLAIAKSADRDAYAPGETIAYTITVTNAGGTSVPREDIVVNDPRLAGLAPLGPGAKAGDSLAPGASLVYGGTRVATGAECGPLENTATVELRGGKKSGLRDTNPANDSATAWVQVEGGTCAPGAVQGEIAKPVPAPAPSGVREAMPQSVSYVCPRPRLRARVTGPAALKAGGTALFRVRVRNGAGAARARHAHLTVRLPGGFTLARPMASSTMANGTMQWSLGTLGPRRARSVALALRADRTLEGSRTLSASVSAACGSARATALVRVAQAVETQARPAVTG